MRGEKMKDLKKEMWYEKQSPLGASFHSFYETCKNETILDDKTAAMLKLALACVFRCPHCTEQHIQHLRTMGVSRREITEVLMITAVEGAGTQLYWHKKLFENYLDTDVKKEEKCMP